MITAQVLDELADCLSIAEENVFFNRACNNQEHNSFFKFSKDKISDMKDQTHKKMKQDAIVEALLEIRFASSEISEVVIGKLSDVELWEGGSILNRLSNADIPESIRQQDPGLRNLPIIEKRSMDKARALRVGSHVLSYHVYAPYLGGDSFESELNRATQHLFGKLENIKVNRLGFRYVNFLTASKHRIHGLDDLAFQLVVGEERLNQDLNLAFRKRVDADHVVVSKIATPEFVRADAIAQDLVSVIDIDVFTPDGYLAIDSASVSAWISQARQYEKDAFFSFFSNDLKNRLMED